jgi:DNA-binding HxlR family transcriptional regulator
MADESVSPPSGRAGLTPERQAIILSKRYLASMSGVESRRASENQRAGGPTASSPKKGGCEVTELFALLGQPHMHDILYAFVGVPGQSIRFTELQVRLRLSPKTLSRRLKALVEAGILARRSFNEIPPRVEYEPTQKLTELTELYAVLSKWAVRHSLRPVPSVSVVGRLS